MPFAFRPLSLRRFAVLLLLLLGSASVPAMAKDTQVEVELWRLDCGTLEIANLDEYSDSYDYVGRKMTFTGSCYLIRHGEQFLLWDSGLNAKFLGQGGNEGDDHMILRRRIVDQLADLNVVPSQISYLGISHYHYDHTGQAADFPGATLLIDKRDWEVVTQVPRLSEQLSPWAKDKGKVEPLSYDHDVFGDGTVVMLKVPGHTPGHRALLVRLAGRGAVLLSGDAVHFRENWRNRGVPGFNTSRSETLASLDRLQAIADRLSATLVIQHEPADIDLLPAFPASAR